MRAMKSTAELHMSLLITSAWNQLQVRHQDNAERGPTLEYQYRN
jgi:hypothetical protein